MFGKAGDGVRKSDEAEDEAVLRHQANTKSKKLVDEKPKTLEAV